MGCLGRRRYGPYLDFAPACSPLHVDFTDAGVRVVGVPRQGELTRIERRVRERVTIIGTSWRSDPQPASQTMP